MKHSHKHSLYFRRLFICLLVGLVGLGLYLSFCLFAFHQSSNTKKYFCSNGEQRHTNLLVSLKKIVYCSKPSLFILWTYPDLTERNWNKPSLAACYSDVIVHTTLYPISSLFIQCPQVSPTNHCLTDEATVSPNSAACCWILPRVPSSGLKRKRNGQKTERIHILLTLSEVCRSVPGSRVYP